MEELTPYEECVELINFHIGDRHRHSNIEVYGEAIAFHWFTQQAPISQGDHIPLYWTAFMPVSFDNS